MGKRRQPGSGAGETITEPHAFDTGVTDHQEAKDELTATASLENGIEIFDQTEQTDQRQCTGNHAGMVRVQVGGCSGLRHLLWSVLANGLFHPETLLVPAC